MFILYLIYWFAKKKKIKDIIEYSNGWLLFICSLSFIYLKTYLEQYNNKSFIYIHTFWDAVKITGNNLITFVENILINIIFKDFS